MTEENSERSDTDNNERPEENTTGSTELTLLGIRLPPSFVFWFAVIMAAISVFVIIQKATEHRAGDITLYYGVTSGMRDIGSAIPVVSLIVALAVNARSASMTLATYFKQKADEVRKRNEARSYAKGKAEGEAEARAEDLAWNKRRLEAEARGKPFNEPFPGTEENLE